VKSRASAKEDEAARARRRLERRRVFFMAVFPIVIILTIITISSEHARRPLLNKKTSAGEGEKSPSGDVVGSQLSGERN
jgi:hypothetical protein